MILVAIIVAGLSIPVTLLISRLTAHLNENSSGIILGALVVGLIIVALQVPRDRAMERYREADKQEFMTAITTMAAKQRGDTMRFDVTPTWANQPQLPAPQDPPSFWPGGQQQAGYGQDYRFALPNLSDEDFMG